MAWSWGCASCQEHIQAPTIQGQQIESATELAHGRQNDTDTLIFALSGMAIVAFMGCGALIAWSHNHDRVTAQGAGMLLVVLSDVGAALLGWGYIACVHAWR